MPKKTLPSKEGKELDKAMRHDCELPEVENILVRYIDSGYFVDLRRKLKQFTMCSKDNPRAKLYLKSSSAIQIDRIHHLRHYYSMIHPYSVARIVWETIMTFVLLLLLIYVPLRFAGIDHHTVYFLMGLDLICILDIAITFRTGFQHSVTKKVVMNPKTVTKHYLTTWFIFDFVASINGDVICLIFPVSVDYSWMVRLHSLLRIVRLATLLKYVERIREWTQLNLCAFKMVQVFIVVGILIGWNTCLLYKLAAWNREEWFVRTEGKYYRLRLTFLRITTNLLLITHGEVISRSEIVILAESFWLITGFAMQVFITGNVIQFVLKAASQSDKYYKIVQQFGEYMKSRNLPDVVRKRVYDFFEFRFQRNFYKEKDILSTLSNTLRQEIVFHTAKELLTKSTMFNGLPDALLSRICHGMKMEVCLPNDVVFPIGSQADTMYFMMSGMVAVYNENGVEVCHLGDQSCFGEGAFFSKLKVRLSTVVAIDYCEMCTLSNANFLRAVSPYPDLLERIMMISNARVKKFYESLSDGDDSIDEERRHSYYNI